MNDKREKFLEEMNRDTEFEKREIIAKEKKKIYAAKNRDKFRENQRRYDAKPEVKERKKISRRIHYLKNKEKIQAKARLRYYDNRELMLKRNNRYRIIRNNRDLPYSLFEKSIKEKERYIPDSILYAINNLLEFTEEQLNLWFEDIRK